MEAIQARLRQQEEENRQLAAERKRKLEELQQKVGGWVGGRVEGCASSPYAGEPSTARKPCLARPGCLMACLSR